MLHRVADQPGGGVPFVLMQIDGLAILWFLPRLVTIVPDMIRAN